VTGVRIHYQKYVKRRRTRLRCRLDDSLRAIHIHCEKLTQDSRHFREVYVYSVLQELLLVSAKRLRSLFLSHSPTSAQILGKEKKIKLVHLEFHRSLLLLIPFLSFLFLSLPHLPSQNLWTSPRKYTRKAQMRDARQCMALQATETMFPFSFTLWRFSITALIAW
jgi:hypothetical protein